ncbi:type II secretion system F family protein [Angustibacter luteus]|uniref:Type II secretion system F family protein n=1 Tax=Angustibacter luteus TaxID=658456 RepID=A0ABW1J9P9_9ACTN
MTALFAVPALCGLVGLGLVVLFAVGYRMTKSDATTGLAVEDLVLLRDEQRREARGLGPLERLAGKLVPSVRSVIGVRGVASLQRRIDAAGRPDGLTVDVFLRRVAMWLLIFLAPGLVFLVNGQPLFTVLCVVAAVFLPLGRLAGAQRIRSETIDRDLPDFLDVLAVTVTAGVAFRPALARVSERFQGPLADEILLTLGQLGNGASLRSAFNALRDRTGSEPVSQFVTAFLQSEELGAPLADTLNQIAADMRRDSGQRMRRRAARAAPRVTLVTSMILVPAVMVTLLVGFFIGSGVDFGALFGG